MIGQGGMQLHRATIESGSAVKEVNATFQVTHAMVPAVKVMAVVARQDGELVADLVTVSVKCELRHTVRGGRERGEKEGGREERVREGGRKGGREVGKGGESEEGREERGREGREREGGRRGGEEVERGRMRGRYVLPFSLFIFFHKNEINYTSEVNF